MLIEQYRPELTRLILECEQVYNMGRRFGEELALLINTHAIAYSDLMEPEQNCAVLTRAFNAAIRDCVNYPKPAEIRLFIQADQAERWIRRQALALPGPDELVAEGKKTPGLGRLCYQARRGVMSAVQILADIGFESCRRQLEKLKEENNAD